MDEDASLLPLLRDRGISSSQVLRLIQAAAETESNKGGEGLWGSLMPYALSIAAGVIMYNLTGEDNSSVDNEVVNDELDVTEQNAISIVNKREKNQTQEILKALADIKQEMTTLSSLVKELISPPIIEDFDIFADPSLKKISIIQSDASTSSETFDLPSLIQRLNDSLLLVQKSNNKDALTNGCNAAIMYISKLLTVPLQPRYKRIYRSNSSFQTTFGSLAGFENILLSVGFVARDGGDFYEWVWSLSDNDEARSGPAPGAARELVTMCLAALQNLAAGEVFVVGES